MNQSSPRRLCFDGSGLRCDSWGPASDSGAIPGAQATSSTAADIIARERSAARVVA